MYSSSAQWYAHVYEQFLQLAVDLGLFLYVVVCFNYCYFVLVLFAFVVLGLVSSVLSQETHETGWEERLWNDLFCVNQSGEMWV